MLYYQTRLSNGPTDFRVILLLYCTYIRAVRYICLILYCIASEGFSPCSIQINLFIKSNAISSYQVYDIMHHAVIDLTKLIRHRPQATILVLQR